MHETLPVIFLVIIGIIIKWSGLVTESDGNSFSKLAFNLTMPAAGFLALQKVSLSGDFIWLTLIGLTTPVVLLGIAFLLSSKLRLERGTLGVFLCSSTVSNIGFFAFPFIATFYGSEGISRLLFFDIGNTIIAYTLTLFVARHYSNIYLAKSRRSILKFLFLPTSLAMIIGVPLGLAKIPLPNGVTSALSLLSNANTPLVMVSLGILISPIGNRIKLVAVGIFIRMIIGSCVGFLLASLFGLHGLTYIIAGVASGMPVGITVLVYTVNEKLDISFATSLLIASYLFGFIWINILFIIFSKQF